MAANPKDTVGINLLVFNGKKDKFRVWTAKFVSHLKEMTVALQGQWLASTTPEPTIKFEDWLQGDPPVATDPDEKRAKWHQYYRTMQVQQIRTLLSKVLPDQFVQQMKESHSEKEPIYRLWAEIEKKYGVSNVTTMKTATRKLMRVADGDFQSVEALFGELRTLKHSINSHSQKYLKRDVVSDDLLILMVLGVLPSEFFGAQIVLDTASFRIVEVEAKLIGIFGSKSKRDIMGMGQSATSKVAGQLHRTNSVEVNNVANGKRKSSSYVTGGTGECFYCFGKSNYLTGGAKHVKKGCPTRKEDFETRGFRSNINEPFKPKVKRHKAEVAVDLVEQFDRDAGYKIANPDAGPDTNLAPNPALSASRVRLMRSRRRSMTW
ncbi:hypothetical protein DYB36_011393 [Aphanomyces astaci]|uniref:Uncharacterized protein n=1 Tax=Aphanomyces astaci TaxID=112090 RepID=A0A397AIQ9_APHAT|nr:hypothetical protein DYB36_011393 [Aphanomyces astaci]